MRQAAKYHCQPPPPSPTACSHPLTARQPHKPLLQLAQAAGRAGPFSILFAWRRALRAALTLARLNSFVNTIDFGLLACQLKRNLFRLTPPPFPISHTQTHTVLKITHQLIIRRQPRNKRLQICIVSALRVCVSGKYTLPLLTGLLVISVVFGGLCEGNTQTGTDVYAAVVSWCACVCIYV